MTREEAIEFGKMWLELQEDCKDSNTYEFFKMAIKALQQEPTYTSEVARKAYKDGKKDGYIQRKIEKIDENDLKVDCISRKAVIDAIYANCIWENEYNLTSSSIKKAVENLPSVKQQETRKGHWIKEESICGWDGYSYQCSECGRSIHLDTIMEDLEDYPYCHCGAYMRE